MVSCSQCEWVGGHLSLSVIASSMCAMLLYPNNPARPAMMDTRAMDRHFSYGMGLGAAPGGFPGGLMTAAPRFLPGQRVVGAPFGGSGGCPPCSMPTFQDLPGLGPQMSGGHNGLASVSSAMASTNMPFLMDGVMLRSPQDRDLPPRCPSMSPLHHQENRSKDGKPYIQH